jgi:hypothetical protein
MNKLNGKEYIHAMEYYSAIKNKVLIHAEVGWGGG